MKIALGDCKTTVEWKKWFAWHPVMLTTYNPEWTFEIVWLGFVERRKHNGRWLYRDVK